MTPPFLNEYIFEINEFPLCGRERDRYTIKDYFFYTSNIQEYGSRSLLVPVSCFINKHEIPDETTLKELINKRVPVIRRIRDFINQTETWSFEYDR
jgi:hypothetical protein